MRDESNKCYGQFKLGQKLHEKAEFLNNMAVCAFRVLKPCQQFWAKERIFKVELDAQKVPSQGEAKGDGVINPLNNNFN